MYSQQVRDVTTISKGFILHGVNCQGAMGSGIAGAIARKWPIVRDTYLAFVQNQRALPGFQTHQLLGNVQIVAAAPKLFVANCFTQNYFGSDGRRYADPQAIETALTRVFAHIEQLQSNDESFDEENFHVYMPQIGCNLGGLSWQVEVQPIVDRLYQNRSFPLTIISI